MVNGKTRRAQHSRVVAGARNACKTLANILVHEEWPSITVPMNEARIWPS